MNFCSTYGYDYGFDGSDEEDVADQDKVTTSSKVRKADTNIISVCFNELISTNQMFAGEPIKCKKCEAIMCKTSLANLTEDKKAWNCEFCYEVNEIDSLNLDQIPNVDDINFLIEAAPQVSDTMDSNVSNDDKYLTYCIDVSGSMDSFVPVNGNTNDRTITRLNAVKAACIENMKNLKSEEPNKRVNLVTFSEKVKYFGDGTKNKLDIGSSDGFQFIQSSIESEGSNLKNYLNNQENMLTLAQNQDGNLKPIRESYANLEHKVKLLQTEGSTALGPALVFSIGYSSRLPGSQIILCTDGCANKGMGSIENNPSSEKFYEDLALYAKSKGIVVNVISMEGTDCKLALLGKVADLTNGQINIVNPLNLSEELKSILQNRLLATDVKAKLIVNNKYLYIRDDDVEVAEASFFESNSTENKTKLDKIKKSIVEKNVGNANVETEITFEYGIRRLNEEDKKTANSLDKLPFQIQISYTMPNGAKALRVVTKTQEFTSDRKRIEDSLFSKDIFYSNYCQKVSTHVTDSKMLAAKHKGQQLRNFNERLKLRMPTSLAQNISAVSSMSNQQQISQLNDLQARDFMLAKKMNAKKFSDN